MQLCRATVAFDNGVEGVEPIRGRGQRKRIGRLCAMIGLTHLARSTGRATACSSRPRSSSSSHPRSRQAISWCSTISVRTKGKGAKAAVRARGAHLIFLGSSCRAIAPTSIRSNSCSPRSNTGCGMLKSVSTPQASRRPTPRHRLPERMHKLSEKVRIRFPSKWSALYLAASPATPTG